MSAQLYQGRRDRKTGACEILADGIPLKLGPSLKVANHSPTGFEWGYAGSGPAQSALAILLDYTGKRHFAERAHQAFKFWFIAKVNKQGWVISAKNLDIFIAKFRAEEAASDRPLCEDCWCDQYLHSDQGRCWNKGCKCGKKVYSKP